MPTLLDETAEAIPALLEQLKYANHGLTYEQTIDVAETLGRLQCMLVTHKTIGAYSAPLLAIWITQYRPVIELLQNAEIVVNGEEKAVK